MLALLQGTLNGALAKNRQRTRGGGNDDVDILQVLRNIGKNNAFATPGLSQCLGPLQGAVGHQEIFHAGVRQMPGHQLNGLAGPDQQCLVTGHVGKNMVRHAHRGIGNGNRVLTNGGLGAHPLCHGKGVLKQTGQEGTAGAVLPGQRVGIFELAKNLRLAKHHGIQAGSHTHHMAHGITVTMQIQGLFQLRYIHVMKAGQPAKHHGDAVIITRQIEFGTVAGGENGRLAGTGRSPELGKRLGHALGRERHPLP